MIRTIASAFLLCGSLLLLSCSGTEKSEPAATQPAASEPAKAEAAPDEHRRDEARTTPKEVKLPSGLQIVDIQTGEGNAAKTGDTVQVHYTGWLIENGKRGNMFDSSVSREPFQMTIGRTSVIRGWTEGLVGMKVGGKRQLLIPPDLAYGPNGRPPVIPPNSTLDFEIELLKLTP